LWGGWWWRGARRCQERVHGGRGQGTATAHRRFTIRRHLGPDLPVVCTRTLTTSSVGCGIE
jgi:hypothetical protein